MEKLRVAVIGCGRILSAYRGAFHKCVDDGKIQLVLAMDKDKSRAEALATEFNGCIFSDAVDIESFKKLMREYKPDVLHILLPHFLHCRYAIAALEEGVNVLTEKPIAITTDDADKMIEAQQKSGKQLGVIFQNRYIDGVQRVRSLIKSGELGKVLGAFSTLNWYRPASYYECDWKGRWETEGGGVVIDQAIHSIDLVRYMTGMDAIKVQGHIARRILQIIEVEDEADAAITLENGAVYSFFASNYYITSSPIRVEISCENGTALLTLDSMDITWKDGRKEEIKPACTLDSDNSTSYWGAFHTMQIEECYNAVLNNTQMPWTPQDARKTQEIVQAIYLSARVNSAVEL